MRNITTTRLLLKSIPKISAQMGGLVSYITTSIFHSACTKVPSPTNDLPLPPVVHATIEKSFIDNNALFIVGDVHGCYDEMQELLTKAKNETTKKLTVVFVGDLVNKGPKNKEVLDYVEESGAYSVRGNHDDAVLRQCLLHKYNVNYEIPMRYDWIKNLSHNNINYLQNLPYTLSIPSCNVIVVHAGLLPGVPLEEQKLSDMVTMRNIIDRDHFDGGPHAIEGPSSDGRPWVSHWAGEERIYFGHDALRGLQSTAFATGLDTGCVYGKYLTGVFVNETGDVQKILQVKARTIYTPVSK